ncbi:MAG: hypothetical protein A3F14_04965 [Gammaproteobacteria bacterium RIFCSPHIGHO2_12_FULL_43_28]|nr:MAG: hypothetical protein A3F14_04965 [Gammaproteobacteria bacterium RIFCSPHIGHO2_12_FULL_43_28]
MKSILIVVISTFILVASFVWGKPHLISPKNKPILPLSIVHDNAKLQLVNLDQSKQRPTKHDKFKGSQVAGVNVSVLMSVASAQGLKPKALKTALNAYSWARNHGKLGNNKNTLTVVDFTLPSYEKRMWVLNLHENKVLMKLYTTQGSGSGLVYAKRFSNQSNTKASSLGLYVTSNEYYGGHGKSMRLDGLQKGINDRARIRNVVIHSAFYASPEYIMENHRAGRSWGCFAVAQAKKNALLDYIKGGSAFFAYAPAIENNSITSQGPISI